MTISTENLTQMSPAGMPMKQFPASTRRKDSGGSSQGGPQIGFQPPLGSQTPFSGGHHGKHASIMTGIGGSQRKLDIGGTRH